MKFSFISAWLIGAIVLSCTHVFAVVDTGSCAKTTLTSVRLVDIESFTFLGYSEVNGVKTRCLTVDNFPQLQHVLYRQYSFNYIDPHKSVAITKAGVDAQGLPFYNASVEAMFFGYMLDEFSMRCTPDIRTGVGFVILETCQLWYSVKLTPAMWVIGVLSLLGIGIVIIIVINLFCCMFCKKKSSDGGDDDGVSKI